MVERKNGNRGSWGYRFYQAGRCYKKYASQWGKTEAAAAEREKRVELKNNPPLPPSALSSVAAGYLVDMAERGLSKNRINNVSYSMENHIIPHFGGATAIAAITSEDVNKLIKASKKKGIKGASAKNVFSDFRSCCNWAIAHKLLRDNPAKGADKKLIGSTKVIKAPLNLESFDRAAESLDNEIERAWFDVTRFTGMRKDETNALQWDDVRFDLGMGRVPGTKTEDSDQWMPWAPVVMQILKRLYDKRDPNIPWVFPGRSSTTQGKKVYRRDPMFNRIYKDTGIKLRPKDL